jgi:hypothetical protein
VESALVQEKTSNARKIFNNLVKEFPLESSKSLLDLKIQLSEYMLLEDNSARIVGLKTMIENTESFSVVGLET